MAAVEGDTGPWRRRLPARILGYGTARLGLFVAAWAILLLLGVDGMLLLLGALVSSTVLSYPLLAPHRQAIAEEWVRRHRTGGPGAASDEGGKDVPGGRRDTSDRR